MTISKLAAAPALALALAFAGVASPALAQAEIAVGTTIYGSDGAVIGTIERVEGGNLVLNTGSVSAALPASTFGESDKGPVVGWTKAELEAEVNAANQQAAAALAAALVEGAEVYSVDSVLLGKVTSVEDALVVIALDSGPASLPKEQIALQADRVTFLATAADLQAAVAAQGGD